MVYGRYNELVNEDYFMVYKPTNITGGPPSPHPILPRGSRGKMRQQLIATRKCCSYSEPNQLSEMYRSAPPSKQGDR